MSTQIELARAENRPLNPPKNTLREENTMTERTRNVQIKFYVTEEEAAFLQQKITESGKSRREFFLQLAQTGKIVRLEPLVVELKKQGGNLNQIAKYFNTHGNSALNSQSVAEGINRILNEVGKTWQLLNQFLADQSKTQSITSRRKRKPRQI